MVTALHSESCRSSVTILPWNDPKRRSPLPEHGSYVLDQLLRLFVRRKMAAVLMFRLEHDVSEGAEPSAIPQPPGSAFTLSYEADWCWIRTFQALG